MAGIFSFRSRMSLTSFLAVFSVYFIFIGISHFHSYALMSLFLRFFDEFFYKKALFFRLLSFF